MIQLATEYLKLPLQFPWGELPRNPHVEATPKTNAWNVNLLYYTSGFL